MAYQSFNSKNAKHKAVVLISDGEDHEDKAIAEARKIGKKGIMLCTVGVGSENGSTIRLPDGSIKKDGEGNEVISKMNEEELNKIAEAGQGLFVNLNSVESSVGQVANRLKQISKTNLGESQLANYSSFFQYFLIVMLLFLLIEFFTPAKKSKKRLRSAFQVFTFLLLPQFLVAQTTYKNIYRGNELYKKQEFQKAATAYQKSLAEKKSKTKEPAQFNLGNALLRAKDPEQALKQYEYVGTKTKNPKMSSYAFHNAGNVRATQKKWQEAINYYKASLKKNPKAQQTKYNLAYAQQKLKEQQDQQKKDKQDQQDKQEEDKDQKEQPNKPEDEKEDQNKDEQQDQNKQKPKPQPSKLSEQQAKKILDALNREEKKLKDNKQKEKGRVYHLDKDW
jgi:Ca-activated chloride channel family protein